MYIFLTRAACLEGKKKENFNKCSTFIFPTGGGIRQLISGASTLTLDAKCCFSPQRQTPIRWTRNAAALMTGDLAIRWGGWRVERMSWKVEGGTRSLRNSMMEVGPGDGMMVGPNLRVSECRALQMFPVWKGSLMGNQWQGCAYDRHLGGAGARGRWRTLFPVIAAALSDAISHSKKQFDHQMFRLNMVK